VRGHFALLCCCQTVLLLLAVLLLFVLLLPLQNGTVSSCLLVLRLHPCPLPIVPLAVFWWRLPSHHQP
jgi:hypothetical protein